MKKGKNKDTHRVQLDLQERALNEVDRVCDKTGLSSRADAIRVGINLLRWVVKQLSEESEICVRNKEGKVTQVLFVLPTLTGEKGG